MDKATASGAVDRGSIPFRGANHIYPHLPYWQWGFFIGSLMLQGKRIAPPLLSRFLLPENLLKTITFLLLKPEGPGSLFLELIAKMRFAAVCEV